MSNQTKRLSDVTKKQTIDRASKLASSFLPDIDEPGPIPAVNTPPAESVPAAATDYIELDQKDVADDRASAVSSPPAPTVKAMAGPAPDRPKERTRRSGLTIDLAETVNQPVPEGLRCTRMIQLSDEHHDMLRELHFKLKKPMTVILYNLLEPAHQALLREKMKGD